MWLRLVHELLQVYLEVSHVPNSVLLGEMCALHQVRLVHSKVCPWLRAKVELLQYGMWPSLLQSSRVRVYLPIQIVWICHHMPFLSVQLWH
jgi:hypothetical protein